MPPHESMAFRSTYLITYLIYSHHKLLENKIWLDFGLQGTIHTFLSYNRTFMEDDIEGKTFHPFYHACIKQPKLI